MEFARAVYEVARKDVLQHVRTKRLLAIGLFFFLALQIVTLVIPLAFDLVDGAPEGDQPAHENTWFFFHLNASLIGGLFAVQLLCIVLTADAVCSEWGNRTIFLLLSKPVSRTAFVVGKYVGALASIVPLVVGLYLLQYVLLMAAFPGQPSGEEAFGFVRMLAMLALGSMSLGAVALFVSTLTRSTVLALILTLLSALFLFPIVSLIGDIQYGVDQTRASRDFDGSAAVEPIDPEAWKYDWSHYATPSSAFAAAPSQLIPGEEDDFGFVLSAFFPQSAPHRPWASILSGVVFTVLFVGLAILRVNVRDFE